jgi:membrane protease YdiL (CAAX protease family)
MWNRPPEVAEPAPKGGFALGVALLLFGVIVLSNLFVLRPRLTDRADVWATRVVQADYAVRMLYGGILPMEAARSGEWERTLKLLTGRDAPLDALARAVILLHDRESALGQEAARERIRQLLRRMPDAPTRLSPDQKKAIVRWCETVYGQRRPSASPEEKAQLQRAIEQADLGWMRLLAMKHLEFLYGDPEAARQWDVRARQEANRLQRSLLMVFAGVVLLLLAGIAVWLAYAVWKSTSRLPRLSSPVLARHHADAVLWGLVAYFAAMLLVGWIAGVFMRALSPSTPLLVVLVLANQVLTGGFALWLLSRLMRRRGLRWQDIGLTWEPPLAHLGWGLGAYVAMIPVLLVTVALLQALLPAIPSPAHPIARVASAENPLWVTILLFLMVAVFASVFEEIFFRAVLLNALWAQTGSKWVGILGSALVFSVLHPQLYLGWIAIFVIGVMLGGLFVERRSVVPCIWMHALHNALLLVAAQSLKIFG